MVTLVSTGTCIASAGKRGAIPLLGHLPHARGAAASVCIHQTSSRAVAQVLRTGFTRLSRRGLPLPRTLYAPFENTHTYTIQYFVYFVNIELYSVYGTIDGGTYAD
jgi:hypothetical protein